MYFLATLGVFIVYFLGLAVAWFLFRSPLFRVNKIIVQGNDSVSSDAVVSLVEAAIMPPAERKWSLKPVIGFDNMFVWPSSIPSSTLAWIPQLAGLSVSKDYFSHTITIMVAERQPVGIWCFVPQANGDEQCFSFDKTGDMFERTYDTEGSDIMVVHDHTQKPTGVNQQILPPEFASNMVSIVNVLTAAQVNTADIALNDLSLEEVDVTTVNGPAIYFSLRFPADNYLQVIEDLMKQSNWSKLSYIDCRTENRVYYK